MDIDNDLFHNQRIIKKLDEWVKDCQPYAEKGQCATYIPALTNTNLTNLGVCIIGSDGKKIKSGNWEDNFTLQSISKVIGFIGACLDYGIPYVLDRVDVEPTGDAFNSIIRLEINNYGKPFNPMINAGAITISSMLGGRSPQKKLDFLSTLIEQMIGKRPTINEKVFQSEWKTAHRNKALAYYLKENGFLESEVDEALEVYLKQCSMEVNTEDIALIGLTLAYDGYNPLSKERVISKDIAKLTKALMLTCGMYNASGKFAAFIGVPAKSGVSGGIMASVPPYVRSHELPFQKGCGIGIYGPSIDQYGNSVAGVELLKRITREWDFSIF
ncbi:glutaminase [Priestia aryabhattai]